MGLLTPFCRLTANHRRRLGSAFFLWPRLCRRSSGYYNAGGYSRGYGHGYGGGYSSRGGGGWVEEVTAVGAEVATAEVAMVAVVAAMVAVVANSSLCL